MPGRFELTSTLAKIWHAPDQLRLMDPLPPMHRRGIIAGFLLVIIGFLLPSGDNSTPTQASREANLDLQSQSQPQGSGNQAVPLPPITNTPTVSDADQVAPVALKPFRMNSQTRRKPLPLLSRINNRRSSSLLRALNSSGAPTGLNPAKRWRSCSATTVCQPLTSMPWRRSKAPANH